MEPKQIYFKAIGLDDNNKFSVKLTEKKNTVKEKKEVEKIKCPKNTYLLDSLKVNGEIEDDIAKWRHYNTIKILSHQINEIFKKCCLQMNYFFLKIKE